MAPIWRTRSRLNAMTTGQKLSLMRKGCPHESREGVQERPTACATDRVRPPCGCGAPAAGQPWWPPGSQHGRVVTGSGPPRAARPDGWRHRGGGSTARGHTGPSPAAGHGRGGGRLPGPPRQTVTTCCQMPEYGHGSGHKPSRVARCGYVPGHRWAFSRLGSRASHALMSWGYTPCSREAHRKIMSPLSRRWHCTTPSGGGWTCRPYSRPVPANVRAHHQARAGVEV